MPPRPIKQEPSASNSLPSPLTDSPLPSPLPTSSNYTDFVLRSTAPSSSSGWKHNIMKFVTVGERVVDPAQPDTFTRPVKLNRKDPRTVRRLTDEDRERHNTRAMQRAAEARGAAMDVDVKSEVKGEEDEKPGASVKAEKEELDLSLVGKGTSGLVPSARQRGGGGMFKKKTRRVYVSSEEARRLKREEWQPWVLEDDEGAERWIGRMEGGAGEMDVQGGGSGGGAAADQGRIAQGEKNGAGLKGWRPAAAASDAGGGGSSYVAFVFGDNGDEFQVVPIHRWYKFNQGPKYLTLAEEEAEEEYNRQQKSKEAERWIMHRRAAPPSTSGSSTPQPSATVSASQPSVSAAALRSRMMAKSAAGIRVDGADDVRGRPRVRTVISTGDGGNGAKGGKRRNRQEQEQGDDEFDYEEDFQDDEEGIAKIDDLADEEETKELEERIRREMRAAERPDTIPDDDEEDEIDALTNTGKELKKLVKKSDKSGAYESDEDENPYASSDEDDTASITSESRPAPSSRQSSPQPPSARAHSPSRGASHSRHASPSTGAGSALVAKRATSPSGRSSRAPSPGPSSGKRKRTADGAGSDSDLDGTKRRKNLSLTAKSPSPGADASGLLTQADLVAYLKTRPNQTSTTKEVLTHFRKALKSEPGNKAAIGGLLKAVANFVEGTLVLKPGL
ncbi:SPOSA6832_00531 [Sporobolomyces salmonicolor]|uniref:Transcription initiation factor IIF subunit alpha n=1 Tax=Sporidiobolus salmonicolor TaxID=5005 RepID=A0A0D6EHH9_SPOSA|nr:SPOSA6832_00531 [Sporobolomyces salmonicolor]